MYTLQAGILDTLVGSRERGWLSRRAVDTLMKMVGDCSQRLVHNADVTIVNDVTIDNCGDDGDGYALWIECGDLEIVSETNLASGDATPLWGKAINNWVSVVGNNSYVDCVESDRAGSTSGDPVRVYLLRYSGSDPNVRTGDVIAYLLDPTGNAIACSDVSDDPIGTVKVWYYDPADAGNPIRGGWRVYTAMGGRTPAGYQDGSPTFGTLLNTGGADTEPQHDAATSGSGGGNSGSGTATVTVNAGGPSTGSISGNTDSTTVSGTIGNETVTFTAGDVDTDSEVTLITVDDHPDHWHRLVYTSTSGGRSSISGVAAYTIGESTGPENIDLEHDDLDDPGHDHVLDGDDLETMTITGATHNHTHTGAGHVHAFGAISMSASHTHTASGGSHTHGWSHTHGVPVIEHTGSNLQPSIVKVFIERYE